MAGLATGADAGAAGGDATGDVAATLVDDGGFGTKDEQAAQGAGSTAMASCPLATNHATSLPEPAPMLSIKPVPSGAKSRAL